MSPRALVHNMTSTGSCKPVPILAGTELWPCILNVGLKNPEIHLCFYIFHAQGNQDMSWLLLCLQLFSGPRTKFRPHYPPSRKEVTPHALCHCRAVDTTQVTDLGHLRSHWRGPDSHTLPSPGPDIPAAGSTWLRGAGQDSQGQGPK